MNDNKNDFPKKAYVSTALKKNEIVISKASKNWVFKCVLL